MNQDRLQRIAEIGYIGLILTIAVVLRHEAQRLPPAPYDPLGPGSFPLWVSYGLAALAIAMAARLLLGRSIGRASHSMVTGLDGQAEHALSPWTAVLLLLFSLAYGAALALGLPFLIVTMVYLFAGGAVLGSLTRRRLLIVAVYAVIAAIALDFLFRRLFSLDLS